MHHFTTLYPSTINLNVYFYAVTRPTEGLTTAPVDRTPIYASQVRRVAVQLPLGQLDGRDYEQRLHSVVPLLKSTGDNPDNRSNLIRSPGFLGGQEEWRFTYFTVCLFLKGCCSPSTSQYYWNVFTRLLL